MTDAHEWTSGYLQLLAFWMTCGLGTAFLARRRGRPPFFWGVFGAFAVLPTVLVLFTRGPAKERRRIDAAGRFLSAVSLSLLVLLALLPAWVGFLSAAAEQWAGEGRDLSPAWQRLLGLANVVYRHPLVIGAGLVSLASILRVAAVHQARDRGSVER